MIIKGSYNIYSALFIDIGISRCYLLAGNSESKPHFAKMESQALSKMRSNGLKSMI